MLSVHPRLSLTKVSLWDFVSAVLPPHTPNNCSASLRSPLPRDFGESFSHVSPMSRWRVGKLMSQRLTSREGGRGWRGKVGGRRGQVQHAGIYRPGSSGPNHNQMLPPEEWSQGEMESGDLSNCGRSEGWCARGPLHLERLWPGLLSPPRPLCLEPKAPRLAMPPPDRKIPASWLPLEAEFLCE